MFAIWPKSFQYTHIYYIDKQGNYKNVENCFMSVGGNINLNYFFQAIPNNII